MDKGPERLRLTVYGQPAGAGSKTPMPKGRMVGGRFQAVVDRVGRPVFYVKPSSEKTKPWMEAVAKEAQKAWIGLGPLSGPVWVDCTFYERRPAGHFGSGRERLLRPSAPAFPDVTTTHDCGKMRRAIEDALTTAGIWGDDKQVVEAADRKRYCDEGDEPRAVICVGVMEWATVEEAGITSPAPPGQAALV